jgi:hypothetical protein
LFVLQISYFWSMLFLSIWVVSLVSFVNSYLKKHSKDIQWAFFIAFIGVMFTKTPDPFKNQELVRLTKFIGQLIFLGSHTYIHVKFETAKFLKSLLWIQKATLFIVFLTWYLRWPGSHPAVLLNLILIPLIILKFKSLNEPLKWSVVNVIIAVLIELALRAPYLLSL